MVVVGELLAEEAVEKYADVGVTSDGVSRGSANTGWAKTSVLSASG